MNSSSMLLPKLKDMDLDAIIAAVGPARSVQYNKPHVYPMAAPMFLKRPGVQRERPTDGHVEVYVHLPFCSYKCNFCTYATRQGARAEQMEAYVAALRKETDWIEPGTQLVELYVGGGTPTVLSPSLLDEVLHAVWQRVRAPSETVHTVECSPESITPDHVRVLLQRRIGRVSMGIQTLDDRVLRRLNRHHSAREALSACELLISRGLMLNVDLIYGLPGQSEESFTRDLRAVAAQGVHSVTVYNLRLNEKTPVARKLDDDEQLELERLVRWRAMIHDCAADLGFKQTRWHTFVRERLEDEADHPARRFENYPAFGNQIGLGMSARSRLNSVVYRNHPEIKPYLQRIADGTSPVEQVFALSEADQKALFIGQHLGNGRPLDRSQYENHFGSSFEADFSAALHRLRVSQLIDEDSTCVTLTETGRLVFDLVNWMFYPQDAHDWIAERQGVEIGTRSGRGKKT